MRRKTPNAHRQTRTPAMAWIGNARRTARVSGSFGDALSRRSHQCEGVRENASSGGGGKTSRYRLRRPAPKRWSAPRVTRPPRSRVARGQGGTCEAAVVPCAEATLEALRFRAEQATQRLRLAGIQAVTQSPKPPRLLHRADDAAFALALGRHRGLGETPRPRGDVEGAVHPFDDLVGGSAAGDLAGGRDQARAAEGSRQRLFRPGRGPCVRYRSRRDGRRRSRDGPRRPK